MPFCIVKSLTNNKYFIRVLTYRSSDGDYCVSPVCPRAQAARESRPAINYNPGMHVHICDKNCNIDTDNNFIVLIPGSSITGKGEPDAG